MDRQSKHIFVADLREKLATASLVVVTRQSGLTVAEMDTLRGDVRAAQAKLKVPKNTLARLALEDSPHAGLVSLLVGPTMLAYSVDPVAAAKVVCAFAKKNPKLEIVGGILNGALLNQSQIQALAQLPSLDELRGTLLGLFMAPASKIARITAAPASQLARVFSAYAAK